ncbi:MAG TPA: hypothetical protein VMR81_00785 [Patescibacteria group bacterium]|nr:hypothetical protein [Patescibacteria group bacterium]
MSTISCSIYLPNKEEKYDKVAHVVVPSESGELDIYPGHAECYALVSGADVKIITTDGKEIALHVPEGGCYFANNRFVLFVSA